MQPEILDLFPTPVVRYRVDPSQWAAQLTQEPMHYTGSHSYSQNTRILDQYTDLTEILESCCTDYAQTVLGLRDPQQAQSSWLNHSQGQDFTHEHMHSNSAIAACWYILLPDGRDRIRFHKYDARYWGIHSLIFDPDPERAQRSPYAQHTVEVSVTEGDLLVWPAWLLHSVPPMTVQGDRWSLAFNTMPRSGWGSGLHEYRIPSR